MAGFNLGRLPKEFIDQVFNGAEDRLGDAAARVAAGIPPKYNVGTRVQRNRKGRPSALVTIMEPHGTLIEAKHGHLMRSASGAGLDINRRG